MLVSLFTELEQEVKRLVDALSTAKAQMSNLQTDMQTIQASHGDGDQAASTIDELRQTLEDKDETIKTLELTIKRLETALERERSKKGGSGGSSGSNGSAGRSSQLAADNDSLRKDLAHKNRQIESLEEQLRRSTSADIQRLKRGMTSFRMITFTDPGSNLAQLRGSIRNFHPLQIAINIDISQYLVPNYNTNACFLLNRNVQ